MTYYLDTSVLIAALVPEAATESVQGWLAARERDVLAVSDWTVAEAASALSMKVRLGHLSEVQRREVDGVLRSWLDESLERLPVSRAAFAEATALLKRHDTDLSAAAGLHLATSNGHGAQLVTLDRRLARATAALGLTPALEPTS